MMTERAFARDRDDDIPDDVLRAEEAIAALSDTFLEWMGDALGQSREALADAFADPTGHRDLIGRLFTLAHDMKGQGGAFDYHLVSELAGLLCEFIRDAKQALNPVQLKVVEAHLDAIAFVMDRAITGDGGEIGRKLLSKLRDVARCVDKPA